MTSSHHLLLHSKHRTGIARSWIKTSEVLNFLGLSSQLLKLRS